MGRCPQEAAAAFGADPMGRMVLRQSKDKWGFDALFRVLAVSAAVILAAVFLLPQRLPAPQAVPAEA
jgi:hypothetical protein